MTRARRERRRAAKRQYRAARAVEVALSLSQPIDFFNAAAYRLSRDRLEEMIQDLAHPPAPP